MIKRKLSFIVLCILFGGSISESNCMLRLSADQDFTNSANVKKISNREKFQKESDEREIALKNQLNQEALALKNQSDWEALNNALASGRRFKYSRETGVVYFNPLYPTVRNIGLYTFAIGVNALIIYGYMQLPSEHKPN